MPEPRVVRPSLKLVVVWYVVVFALLAAAAYGTYAYFEKPFNPWHLIVLVLLVIPITKHLSTRTVSLSIDSDHLTLESGLLSRTRRTMDLAKVQDVTARQSFWERLFGMGDL